MPNLPETCHEVRLAARPAGLPMLSHFSVVATPLPVPGPGEVLIRNRFVPVSASLRMMISEGACDVPGVPFPALAPGDTIPGGAIGEVAGGSSELRPGDLVTGDFGWREFAVAAAADCAALEDSLPDPVAHLSHGWTAYAALTRGLRVSPGDTVFITSAAGAIGSMAGQIARLLGAGRVIGSTSSVAKGERLVTELGYDAAVIRDAGGSLGEQLARVAPEGIDVCLDNVGGDQLRAAVAAAREGARILVLGALSGQLAPTGTGRTAPVTLDSFQILLKKITLRGYSADDDPDVREDWTRLFAEWLRAGQITFPHVRVPGITNAPQALLDAMHGRHLGMTILEP